MLQDRAVISQTFKGNGQCWPLSLKSVDFATPSNPLITDFFFFQMAVCTAAVILLLNLWSEKKSGLSVEVVKKDMKDVYMCMQALKSVEKRWQAAGRLW